MGNLNLLYIYMNVSVYFTSRQLLVWYRIMP